MGLSREGFRTSILMAAWAAYVLIGQGDYQLILGIVVTAASRRQLTECLPVAFAWLMLLMMVTSRELNKKTSGFEMPKIPKEPWFYKEQLIYAPPLPSDFKEGFSGRGGVSSEFMRRWADDIPRNGYQQHSPAVKDLEKMGYSGMAVIAAEARIIGSFGSSGLCSDPVRCQDYAYQIVNQGGTAMMGQLGTASLRTPAGWFPVMVAKTHLGNGQIIYVVAWDPHTQPVKTVPRDRKGRPALLNRDRPRVQAPLVAGAAREAEDIFDQQLQGWDRAVARPWAAIHQRMKAKA